VPIAAAAAAAAARYISELSIRVDAMHQRCLSGQQPSLVAVTPMLCDCVGFSLLQKRLAARGALLVVSVSARSRDVTRRAVAQRLIKSSQINHRWFRSIATANRADRSGKKASVRIEIKTIW